MGIPLAFSRLIDPFLFKVLRKSFCGKRKKDGKTEGKLEYFDESLLSFLNSALNVEFVYLILLGIKKFVRVEREFM